MEPDKNTEHYLKSEHGKIETKKYATDVLGIIVSFVFCLLTVLELWWALESGPAVKDNDALAKSKSSCWDLICKRHCNDKWLHFKFRDQKNMLLYFALIGCKTTFCHCYVVEVVYYWTHYVLR